jgi:hypothetical protein
MINLSRRYATMITLISNDPNCQFLSTIAVHERYYGGCEEETPAFYDMQGLV